MVQPNGSRGRIVMSGEAVRDVDDTTAPDESAPAADVEAADLGIEEFDLDDIEVIESKVFG
jgi:hypothetical protein